MCADGGVLSDAALQQLDEAAYTGAVRLEGGYAAWGEVRMLLHCVKAPRALINSLN